jgi:hypothetical protein
MSGRLHKETILVQTPRSLRKRREAVVAEQNRSLQTIVAAVGRGKAVGGAP